MQFLYFLPGRQAVGSVQELQDVGLGHVFQAAGGGIPETTYAVRGVINGPEGQNGCVVAIARDRLKFAKDQQTWQKHFRDGYWCGFWNDAKPTPADLLRPDALPGEKITGNDGQTWIAPHAREFVEHEGDVFGVPALPQELALDADGNWMPGAVRETHRRLWDLVSEFTELLCESAEAQLSFSYPQIDELAELALAANYRISRLEMAMIGMYSDTVRDAVVRAALDLKGFAELLKSVESKKNSDAGTSSSDGPNASNPDEALPTAQPSQT